MWVNFETTFQEKVVEGSYSKFLKTYFWQYSNQILFEKQNHTSILMISTFKNVVTVVDKDLQKKNLNFSNNGYIKNYWALESQLDTKLQGDQDQNLPKYW